MIRISQALFWLAVGVFFCALAFFLGRWTAPSEINQALPSQINTQISPVPPVAPNAVATTHAPADQSVGQALSDLSFDLGGRSSYARDMKRYELLMTLAKANPAAAMQQVSVLRGGLKQKAEREILSLWAERDANGVWSWLSTNRTDNKALFIQVLEPVARVQPNVAIGYAEGLVATHRELRRDVYQALITGLAQGGAYSQAVTLIEKLTIEAEAKTAFINQLLEDWATYEPQEALNWLERQPQDYKEKHLDKLLKTWVAGEPQVAIDAAMALTGGARNELLQTAFPKWLVADPALAVNWLAAQKPAPELDGLISEVVLSDYLKDQESQALSWAEKIIAEEARLRAITSILSALKQRNSAAALAQLQSLKSLTETQRAQLYTELAFKSSN